MLDKTLLKIWILGSSYSLLAQQLLTRERISISLIRSFDLDKSAVEFSNKFLETWVWKDWSFRAFHLDANKLKFNETAFGGEPDLVINANVEKFASRNWWDNIPSGKLVVLQGRLEDNSDYVFKNPNLTAIKNEFALEKVLFEGTKTFTFAQYSTTRWMLIGTKY